MKIGRKIALFYTLVTVLTTMAVIGVFYLFSSRYIDGLYRSYLREKAFLTAQKHWERDEVDEQSYQTIQRKYDGAAAGGQRVCCNVVMPWCVIR